MSAFSILCERYPYLEDVWYEVLMTFVLPSQSNVATWKMLALTELLMRHSDGKYAYHTWSKVWYERSDVIVQLWAIVWNEYAPGMSPFTVRYRTNRHEMLPWEEDCMVGILKIDLDYIHSADPTDDAFFVRCTVCGEQSGHDTWIYSERFSLLDYGDVHINVCEVCLVRSRIMEEGVIVSDGRTSRVAPYRTCWLEATRRARVEMGREHEHTAHTAEDVWDIMRTLSLSFPEQLRLCEMIQRSNQNVEGG
jgi:hypothetical protein